MTPSLIPALVGSLLALIAVQFTLVGLGVFAASWAWPVHRAVGSAFLLPLAGLAWIVWRNPALRPLRRPVALVAGIYAMQFAWLGLGRLTDLAEIQALHALGGLALAGVTDALFRAARRSPASIA